MSDCKELYSTHHILHNHMPSKASSTCQLKQAVHGNYSMPTIASSALQSETCLLLNMQCCVVVNKKVAAHRPEHQQQQETRQMAEQLTPLYVL